jgi:tetratricopeptide (TPR) repeat protein
MLACGLCHHGLAQALSTTAQKQRALKDLLRAVNTPPYYALDWHNLKIIADDEQSVNKLKDALHRSGRLSYDIMEQELTIDAAAGHPETALAFYDSNILKHPEDKSLPNAACWFRAAHGLDLQNVLSVCNAAVAADRQSYTLVTRGEAELQLSHFQDALHDFNEALGDKTFQNHPMFAEGIFGRGVARMRLGDAKGKRDIIAAIQKNDHVAVSFADIGITP